MAETGSTNSALIEAGKAGAPSGTLLVADVQHAGRGRLGRAWAAPSGSSLLCSVLVRPAFGVDQARLLPAAAGMSMQDAVAEFGVKTELKWPNDLMVGPRKLAGVLSEVVTTDGSWFAVIGTGCNVAWKASGTSEEVPADVRSRVASLDEFTGAADRWLLLCRYVEGLSERLRSIDTVAREYAGRCATVGRQVEVQTVKGSFEAVASGIADDGGLLVDVKGSQRVLHEGDVVHLR